MYLKCAFILLHITGLVVQATEPVYWIEFTDKNNTPFTIDHPEEFLSERSIARRQTQGIAISEQDLPVTPSYLAALRNQGLGVIHTSKWFNGALVTVPESYNIGQTETLPFVALQAILVKPVITQKSNSKFSDKLNLCDARAEENYGTSLNQIQMLGGDKLHQAGYEGAGMLIAILDAGFAGVNQISSLQSVWNNNQVIAMRDFVSNLPSDFYSHYHGTVVFSILAGQQNGILIGSAPEAEYVLVRTEDDDSEYLIEEYNWVCGAEYADSIGVDVINSSLGYSEFDAVMQNHTYTDMDGNTTPITRAADIAASKGMLVVASAGNSGSDLWYYITAPADAHNVLAVGACNSEGDIAYFSSRGPSADGRVKPDVSAQGVSTIAQYPTGEFIECDGTSCSSPVTAGIAACFWEANRHLSNLEVLHIIKQGSSLYHAPNSELGYGIPDMVKSEVLLAKDSINPNANNAKVLLYPVPTNNELTLYIQDDMPWETQIISVNIYNANGKLCYNETFEIFGMVNYIDIKNIANLSTGYYSFDVNIKSEVYSTQFIKL